MVSRKQMAVTTADADDLRVASGSTPPPLPASKLPPIVRFPLILLLSFSISLLLYNFVGDLTRYELSSTSRHVSPEYENVALVFSYLWKTLELGIGWSAGLDDLDLAALTIVSHFPYLYLLNQFFEISATTTFLALAVDTLAISLPIKLLRQRSPTHSKNANAAQVPDRNIIADAQVIGATSALGASIYAVLLFIFYKIGLTTFLVTNFDDIPSVTARDVSTLAFLIPVLFPVGWAAREFVLDPSLGAEAQPNTGDARKAVFNPSTATLAETAEYNFYAHYDKRTRVVIKRTLLLTGWVFLNTVVQVFGRVRGAELLGAIGWSAVFAVPSILVGVAHHAVGNV